MLGALSGLGPVSLALYFPALPTLQTEFDVSTSATQLTVGFFLIGLGIGQPIAGPLSDRLGRRSPLLVSIAIYVLATMACVLAPTIEVLIVSRLIQGVAAAAGIVIARAIVRDLYTGARAARLLSHLVLIYGLAPLLGPLIGGMVLAVSNWHGIFVLMVVFGASLLLVIALCLPETLSIERRQTGQLVQQLRLLPEFVKNRKFLGNAAVLGLGTACVVAYISASSFVLQGHYGVSPQLYGVFFGLNASAMITSSQINAKILERRPPAQILRVAGVCLVVVATLMVAVVLLDLGLWAFSPCLVGMMACWGFIPANAISLAMTDYQENAGSASAFLGVFQHGMGGLIAPAVGLGPVNSALTMSMVIFVSAALLAIIAANSARSPRQV